MIDKEVSPWNDLWMVVSDHRRKEGVSKVRFRGNYFDAKEFLRGAKKKKIRGRLCKVVRGEFAVCLMERHKIIEHYKHHEPANHAENLKKRQKQYDCQ